MEKDIFKEIAENLVTVLPENWEKVCLYCHISEYTYQFSFHVKIDGKYIQCFNLEETYGITEDEVSECFEKLHTLLKPDYEEKKFMVMTYILESSGKFVTEYDYNDCTEHPIAYKQEWKKKYLV